MTAIKGARATLDDLDYAILEALPAYGAKLGKYIDHGIPVKGLNALASPEEGVTITTIGGRVRSLTWAKLIRSVKGITHASSGASYQRTEAGDKALADRGKPKISAVQ